MMDNQVEKVFETKIFNDYQAEKALEKIKDLTEERDRLVNLASLKMVELEDKIESINNDYNKQMEYYEEYLKQFIENAANKKISKTQEKYTLLSGDVIKKLPKKEIVADKMNLIVDDRFKQYVKTDVIKSFDWATLKKTLKLVNDQIVDENGEIIESKGLEIIERPAEYNFKF